MRKLIVLGTILCLLPFTAARAAEPPRRPAKVSVNLDGAPLDHFLEIIQKSCNLRMAYEHDLIANSEPVTLHVEDAELDAVLHAALAPRGLECIYTGETMAAIVRADSDMGMAKAAGRALRTLARLAPKIESARQQGDEILMPEWTDDDDRALAEAYVDLFAAIVSMKMISSQGNSGGIDESVPLILPMLRGFDPDVLVGAAALKYVYNGVRVLTDEQEEELVESLTRLMRHSDPLVRAAAVVLNATDWRHLSLELIDETRYRRKELAGLGPIDQVLRKAAGDNAPEVRAAAAFACLRYGHLKFPGEIQQILRRDGIAAVRALAYLPLREYSEQRPSVSDLSPGLRDANPIVRTVCLKRMIERLHDDPRTRWALLVGREARFIRRLDDERERLQAAMKAEGVADDPWLTLAAEAFAARNTALWYGLFRCESQGGRIRAIPPEVEQVHEHAGAVFARLFASGKRSHMMLACGVLRELLPAWPFGTFVAEPDFDCIAKHMESPHLATRLMCTAACFTLEPAVAEPRVLKALGSDDRLERAAGLRACYAIRRRPASPAVQEKLLALAGSRRPPEAEIAASVIGLAFPTGLGLPIGQSFRTERLRDILRAAFPQSCTEWSGEPGKQNQALLQEAVLKSRDAAAQIDFFRSMAFYWLMQNEAMFLSFITQCEPAALCEIAMFNYRRTQSDTQGLKFTQAVIDAIVERAAGLVRKADGTPNLEVISALARFAVPLRYNDPIGLNAKYYEIVTPFLETCFRPGATDAEIAAGGDLVKAIVGRCWTRPPSIYASIPGVKWGELPEGVRRACARFLGYAGHPRHGKCAVEALALCYRQLRNTEAAPLEPEMVAAIEKARAAIADAGSHADQTHLLLALADRSRGAESGAWRIKLQERLIAGSVPPDLRENVYRAIAETTDQVTTDFQAFLLERIADPDEDVPLRNRMLDVLQRCPDLYGRLFPIIADLAARGESFDVRHAMETIQFNLDREPAADWADAAGALGFAVATCDSTKRCVSAARKTAMGLYVKVVGRDAAEDIEAMIRDEKLLPEIRAAAASQLIAASPDTKLLPALAKNYDALPVEVRMALGLAAAEAVKAEGAADFMARFFRDDALRGEQELTAALERLKVPLTPDLRAALNTLSGDPEYNDLVWQALIRLR